MKFLWITFVFFAFHLSILAQNCLPLKDGEYLLYFNNSKFKQNIKIIGKKWYSELNGEITEFEIIEIGDCAFRLKNKIPPDSTDIFDEVLKTYYHIDGVTKNVYFFQVKVSSNLHVKGDSGMLIRKLYFKRRKN